MGGENPFTVLFDKLSNIEQSILQLKSEFGKQTSPPDPTPEILDLDGACQFTKKKKPTMYQLCHNRQIPFYKSGRRTIFKKSELENWLLKQRVKTIEEIEAETENSIKSKSKKQ